MTIINVYDMAFNLIGVIDSYVSVIWRPAYYDVGDFELYLGASDKAIDLLQRNRLLVRTTDITVDDGNVIYKNVMIIKDIDLTTNVENGDFLSVTGVELKGLLSQRIVWGQVNLTGTVESTVRSLVNGQAINPSDSKRNIPNLILGQSAGLSDSIEKQLTGDNLATAVTDICKSYNYGWDVYGYNHNYVFILYQGLDRSYGQNERPYVVFSDDFENLYNTEYQLISSSYANTALIGGEGEGTSRSYATINNGASGLNRYELFVDARDVSSNSGQIATSTYLGMLQERGAEKLSELAITEGFSGEVVSNGNYRYGVDFDIGDMVTVINSYGISKNVMVLSAIESEDEDGISLIPQFNI